MTKQTVYPKYCAKKGGFKLQFLRQSAFLNSPLFEMSDDLPNKQKLFKMVLMKMLFEKRFNSLPYNPDF